MDAGSLRNFRDFLEIYNKISETCFSKCVETFQNRDVSPEEAHCVDMCSNKFVRVNHKIMGTYMEVQPLIVQKRIEEMEKMAAQQQQQQQEPSTTEPAATEIATVSEEATINTTNES